MEPLTEFVKLATAMLLLATATTKFLSAADGSDDLKEKKEGR